MQGAPPYPDPFPQLTPAIVKMNGKNGKETYGENLRAGFSRLLHLCAYKI